MSLAYLADEFLIGFMLVLAAIPVALAMVDGRKREAQRRRLAELRQAARLAARLRERPAAGTTAASEQPQAH